MPKTIYDAVHYFLNALSANESSWKHNQKTLQMYLDSHKNALDEFGKTKSEQVTGLLQYAAMLITKPEEHDDYPAINFMDGSFD